MIFMTIPRNTRHLAVAFALLGDTVVLAAAGDFDSSYNRLGFTREVIAEASRSFGLAIYPTGEIVSSGFYFDASMQSHAVVWRHLPDGSLDETFGDSGVAFPTWAPSSQFAETSVAIDNQNRIVIVTPMPTSHLVHRLNFDGSVDSSFSGTGSTNVPLGQSVLAIAGVAIQPDDQIVGAGGAINPGSGRSEFVVYRLQEDGQLDPNFGGTGLVYTQMTAGGGIDRATAVALQPDGKIVAAGRARTLQPDSFFDVAVARYSPTGVLDAGFGINGRVIFSVLDDDFGRKVVIQPDGKIVVAGSFCVGPSSDNYCYLGVSRVDDQGMLDLSFGGTGAVYTDVGDQGGFAYDLALGSDDKIVVVGAHQLRLDFSVANSILVRHLPDGSLDPMFGVDGISETNYGYSTSSAGAVRIQSDGQIVVSGSTSRTGGSTSNAVVARYLGSADGNGARGASERTPSPVP